MLAPLRRGGRVGRLGDGGRDAARPPYWFPDWRGETCCIIASGPSLDQGQVDQVRHLRRIAINNSWLKAPDADILYACDGKWWRADGEGYGRHALREFRGLKVSQDAGACEEFGLSRIRLALNKSGALKNEIETEPGVVGGGGNSGFQALNLAIQLGARRIALLGFDMHPGRTVHWHGQHGANLAQPDHELMRRWAGYFAANAERIRGLGVEVLNCTPLSALPCFPRAHIEAL